MRQINITLEKFRKILFLGIVILLGLSTGSSYANSIFSEKEKSLSDGYNAFSLKHSQPAVFLFSSEIEDVEEEIADEDLDNADDFALQGLSFVFTAQPTFQNSLTTDFFSPSDLFTKLSRFILFRNIRI